ncbi:hypothetical protein AHAS_Ahas02G0082800 [Arachis hypogaea]
MRISRMLNAYTYPGCTQDVTRRHPSTARDLRRRDMAILELKNIVTSGTVGNRLGRALSSCRACLLNRARYGSRELRITSHSSTETSSGTFVGTNLSLTWERFLVQSEALIMQSWGMKKDYMLHGRKDTAKN